MNSGPTVPKSFGVLGLNGRAVRRSEEGSDGERGGEGGDADHCCTLRTPPAIGLRL